MIKMMGKNNKKSLSIFSTLPRYEKSKAHNQTGKQMTNSQNYENILDSLFVNVNKSTTRIE